MHARRKPFPRKSGRTVLAGVLWIAGAVIFFSPFLRPRASADTVWDDPGRLVSETDIPFDEDVAEFDAEFELGLADLLAESSEEWFGEDSEALRATGLIRHERLEAGREAYERYCVGCHSPSGDGAGPAARHLSPRPRNFRKGLFKFTSTETGQPPLRRDVFQTITRGLAGSSMPEFRLLSEERRWDIVEYVRYLSVRGLFEQLMVDFAWEEEELPDPAEVAEIVAGRWSEEKVKAVYPPIPETTATEESIARGRELFTDAAGANCAACHGDEGRGDGPTAGDFNDDWGYPIRPRNLTDGVYRAGAEPADLYRSIATGLTGTPMPAYGGSIEAEDIWSLVHFIQSLAEER